MKLLFLLAFVPIVNFCIAGFVELRSGKSLFHRTLSLIPVGLGISAFGVSCAPGGLLHITGLTAPGLSRWLALLSAVIASSGAFINYSRRSSAALVAVGGLILMTLFMFFGEPFV